MVKRLITPCLCLAFLAGCATVDYRACTSVVHLPADRASHFYSDHLTGSSYIELKSDGTYREIAREHLGVWPIDEGTWNQNQEGILTLVSPVMCADVISPPLAVMVGRSEYIAGLPELKQAIQAFLNSSTAARFEVPDYELYLLTDGENELGVRLGDLLESLGKLRVEVNFLLRREFISRAELEQLIGAIDRFLDDPEQRNCQAIPMRYKDRVFLLWLNCGTPQSRSLREICRAIDRAKPENQPIYHDFLIPEEQFEKGVKKPYPFKFYPEMNKITGAE